MFIGGYIIVYLQNRKEVESKKSKEMNITEEIEQYQKLTKFQKDILPLKKKTDFENLTPNRIANANYRFYKIMNDRLFASLIDVFTR